MIAMSPGCTMGLRPGVVASCLFLCPERAAPRYWPNSRALSALLRTAEPFCLLARTDGSPMEPDNTSTVV
jgi:hypothetical protein